MFLAPLAFLIAARAATRTGRQTRHSRAWGPLMATVIEFPSSLRLSQKRASKPLNSDASAEIVFFPGVRYERWDENKAAKPKKRDRRRDRLELEA